MIQLDQHAWNTIGAYGNKIIQTPNLDRISKEGVRFERAYCATPYCSPSRASIVTGQWPHTHKIIYNTGANPRGITIDGLDGTQRIPEQMLYDNGYFIEHFGKWHAGDKQRFSCYSESKHTYEFNKILAKKQHLEFAGIQIQEDEVHVKRHSPYGIVMKKHNYDAYKKAENDGLPSTMLLMGKDTSPVEQNIWYHLADHCSEFIARNKNQQFMVTYSAAPPHPQHIVPDPYYSMYNPDDILLSPSFYHENHPYTNTDSFIRGKYLGEGGTREMLRCYYAQITMMDEAIGKILNSLDNSGILNKTLVVFLSDHGNLNGSHGNLNDKVITSFYEELARIPLMMRLPGVIPAGKTIQACANHVDIAPTILDYLGMNIPQEMQGKSLKPLIEGAEQDGTTARTAWCERPGGRMVTNGNYKYCYYYQGGIEREELFDLHNDPFEMKDLSYDANYVFDKEKMKALLEKHLFDTGDMSLRELLLTGGPVGNRKEIVPGLHHWS
jgi:arylsulfatase A-like enzyme